MASRAFAGIIAPVEQRRITIFVRMWSVAHVVHLAAATGGAIAQPSSMVVFGAALVLIWRPRCMWIVAVMATAQLVDYVIGLPVSPDHWFLLGIGNIVILLSLAADGLRRRPPLSSALPGLRAVLLLGYAFAAMAKYNTSFVDPVASCATAIAHRATFGLAERLPPVWGYASLAIESLIPLLLLFPRTRRHGVRVGLAFHFVLSASPAFAVVDFTAALYALFFLFLPDRDVGLFVARLRWVGQRSAIVRDARRVPPATIVVAFLLLGLIGHIVPVLGRTLVFVAAQIYLVTILVVGIVTWFSRVGQPVRFGRPLLLHVIPVVLLLAWGASPYLGLRTAGVLTMFSNLRTEPGYANHLFVPTYSLTNWQQDLVIIEKSSNAAVQAVADIGIAVPYLQLRQMATGEPDLVISGRRGGAPFAAGPGTEAGPIQPLAGWRYRYVFYRPITTTDAPFCPNA
jgi:hypothetical protein